MLVARHWLDSPRAAAVAMRRADALRDQLHDAQPALIYGAPLIGSTLALGAYQREAFVVGPGAADVARRSTGGGAIYAGEGVFYFAVALDNASVLMDCPPGRILNRNVRGLLQGIRTLGAPAHYFGRDFVSVATRPGVHIAWDEREDGRVLFEAFIAQSRSYVPPADWIAYPALNADPFRGHAPITLVEATPRAADTTALFEHVMAGYAAAYAIDAQPFDVASFVEPLVVAPAVDDQGLLWSPPYEESIGFVYAGVRVNQAKQITAVRLAGDYFQNRQGQQALEHALIGCNVDGTEIGRTINEVYADTRNVIEGIRQMDSLRAVVLFAAERAADVANLQP